MLVIAIAYVFGFVFLSPSYAKTFLCRWKPLILADHLVSTQSSLQMYTTARICLEDTDCVGAFCSAHGLFVLKKQGEHLTTSCFLTIEGNEIAFCGEMRNWFEKRYSCEFLYGSALSVEQKHFWDLTESDP